MGEYRITKYNPANRDNGIYTVDEWTSFSDIGSVFNGTKLTEDIYLKTEKAYIDCCIELINREHISNLSLENLECYKDNITFPTKVFDAEQIRQVITACLREQCWFKLVGKDFFIHFGWDYYMYVGTSLPNVIVEQVATRYGLYCEIFDSPYKE